MEKELNGQMAMHNSGVEACQGNRPVEDWRARMLGVFGGPRDDTETVATKIPGSAFVAVLPNTERELQFDAQYNGAHEQLVDQPGHYKHATFEVIDEMVLAFGLEATIHFCVLNAWKYRNRAPYKGNTKQDMEKADRYMQYAHDLQLKKARMDAAGGSFALPLLMAPGKKPVSGPPKEDKKHGTRR